MKLYYAPGACSLSSHIMLREADLPFDLVKVDLRAKKTEAGDDFASINPKSQVPALILDDGTLLTENAAIAQYLGDKAGLVPAAGTMERYRLQEWLSFIGGELHKTFGPLFNPATPEDFKAATRQRLAAKLAIVNDALQGHDWLLGDHFSVADAYLFAILRWTARFDIDLTPYPNIAFFLERMKQRPKVKEAMAAEGLS